MKKIIISFIVLLLLVIFCVPTYAGTTNKGLVTSYCKKYYKKYKIKYVKEHDKKLNNRKGKKIVYVEVIKSKSHGKYGYTKDKCYVRYNVKVKNGNTVTSYCIYNPKNNACDDVVAVIDNKRIR